MCWGPDKIGRQFNFAGVIKFVISHQKAKLGSAYWKRRCNVGKWELLLAHGLLWEAIMTHGYSFMCPLKGIICLCWLWEESPPQADEKRLLTPSRPHNSTTQQEAVHVFQLPCSVCYTWTTKSIRIEVPPVMLWLHTHSTVGLIAISQLRQLVLFNVKCSPIHTLAEIVKNASIKNSDLFSHFQSQLLSANQCCMCFWHNFINNLGKQRILQQIAVAFWLYCATDNNCFKLSVVKSICSCIMKKNHITAWLWKLTACWKATKNSPKLDILIVLPQLLIQAKFI